MRSFRARGIGDVITHFKNHLTAYLNIKHRGYADDQIPAWFKRPTAEQQAAFNKAVQPDNQPELLKSSGNTFLRGR